MSWPPDLPDHLIVEPWRSTHPLDLEELRTALTLDPCEAIECVATNQESGKREWITALRRASDAQEAEEAPQRHGPPADLSEAIRRAREAHGGRDASARARRKGGRR